MAFLPRDGDEFADEDRTQHANPQVRESNGSRDNLCRPAEPARRGYNPWLHENSRHRRPRVPGLVSGGLRERVDRHPAPRPLLGLRGLVFKSHGSSDIYAFGQAMSRAHDAARNRLIERVQGRVHDMLQSLPAAAAEVSAVTSE